MNIRNLEAGFNSAKEGVSKKVATINREARTHAAISGLRLITVLATLTGAYGVLNAENNASTPNNGGITRVLDQMPNIDLVKAAEASPLNYLKDSVLFDSAVDSQHPYTILERWPDAAGTNRRGTVNQLASGIGFEDFVSADGSELPELRWLDINDVPRNPQGEFMIPDNTGFTLRGLPLREDGRTQPIFIRVNPHKILFVSAGEGQMIWFASNFSMENDATDAVINWPQIDATGDQLANPVGHHAFFRTGKDPVIALQGFIQDNAVLIQYDDPTGSFAEDQVIGQAQLGRQTRALLTEFYDIETGAYKVFRSLDGPKPADDNVRRNFDPKTYFTPVAGNVR